jgi:molybdopterin-guanine dinucleotide biosynthesis protein A
MTVAAAILAGGKATRMGGRQKAFLEVDGRRIVDRQLEVLAPLFPELLVVANDPAPWASFGLPVHPDVVREQGPLAGILTAIEAARAEAVVVVACDMPYLDGRALALLRDAPAELDVVVPVVGDRPEPLHARYRKRCAAEIRRRLAEGELKIARFFDAVATRRIEEETLRALDPTLRFLTNVNAPHDLPTRPTS